MAATTVPEPRLHPVQGYEVTYHCESAEEITRHFASAAGWLVDLASGGVYSAAGTAVATNLGDLRNKLLAKRWIYYQPKSNLWFVDELRSFDSAWAISSGSPTEALAMALASAD